MPQLPSIGHLIQTARDEQKPAKTGMQEGATNARNEHLSSIVDPCKTSVDTETKLPTH